MSGVAGKTRTGVNRMRCWREQPLVHSVGDVHVVVRVSDVSRRHQRPDAEHPKLFWR